MSFNTFMYHSNLVTTLRECQAISSLASLRPSLRDMILCHEKMNCGNNMKLKAGQPSSPEGVSRQLWVALCDQYNKSQLQAISSVIEEPRAIYMSAASGDNVQAERTLNNLDQKNHFPLILLQGPPGTG